MVIAAALDWLADHDGIVQMSGEDGTIRAALRDYRGVAHVAVVSLDSYPSRSAALCGAVERLRHDVPAGRKVPSLRLAASE